MPARKAANRRTAPRLRIDFSRDPRLLAGWRRSNKRLDAVRFGLDQNVFSDLRALCEPTVAFINSAQAREYEQFAALEANEQYFTYDISDLPQHPPIGTSLVADEAVGVDDTADLVRLVRTVDALTPINRDEMGDHKFSFYAICWTAGSTMIGFVSKRDPVVSLTPGVRFFQFANTLRQADTPDLALQESTDIVVMADEVAILRPSAFTTLMSDVGVAFQRVPGDVKKVKKSLASTVPLLPGSEMAIANKAGRLLSFARRLSALPERIGQLEGLDASSLRKTMRTHSVDPRALLDQNGNLSFGDDEVDLFFDVIEGRYFEDELGKERRRADRFSQR